MSPVIKPASPNINLPWKTDVNKKTACVNAHLRALWPVIRLPGHPKFRRLIPDRACLYWPAPTDLPDPKNWGDPVRRSRDIPITRRRCMETDKYVYPRSQFMPYFG